MSSSLSALIEAGLLPRCFVMEGGPAPLPPSFDSALATLQSASHRFSRERQAWALERQELHARVAVLAQEKQQLLGLHELLLGRVSMLEFALQAERRARRTANDGERAGGDVVAAVPAGAATAPAAPQRPPAVDASAGRMRASQAIIQEYLDVIERAEASAATRNVAAAPDASEGQQPLRPATDAPSAKAAGAAAAAPYRPPSTASAPVPFFSMPPLPPTQEQTSAPGVGALPHASPRSGGHSGGSPFADELAAAPAPTAARATLASIAAKAAAAAASAAAEPPAGDAAATPAVAAEEVAVPGPHTGRRRVSITGGKSRPGASAEVARAPRIRGGAAAPGGPPALPAAWQQTAVLRSHVDTLRASVWLPGRSQGAGNAAAGSQQLLTCSDDGTAKVWSISSAPSKITSGGRKGGAAGLGSGAGSSRGLEGGDVTEPLRTFRCGRPVLRAAVITWAPSRGGDEDAFVRACLSAVAADDGLPPAAASVLSDATRTDAVGVLACADGSLCAVLLPSDPPLPASGDGRPSNFSTYDLPSAASLPCLREVGAHADCVWAVMQAPPGYLIAPVVGVSGSGGDSSVSLTELPPGADTRDVPVFLTAGADGLLRLWRLGVRSSDGRPGFGQLGSVAPSTLSHPSTGGTLGEAALAGTGAVAISAVAFDLVAPNLAVWVALHGSEYISKVDLASGGRLVLRARVRPPASPSVGGPSAPIAVTAIVPHPQLPLVFAATTSAACGVAVFDSLSGALLHSLPAHDAGVASLTVDPSGTLLASCGVDGDVRVWSVEARKCLWSTRAHRGKHGETALGVAFHPTSAALLASVGSDSLAKVFTPHAAHADDATSVSGDTRSASAPSALADVPV